MVPSDAQCERYMNGPHCVCILRMRTGFQTFFLLPLLLPTASRIRARDQAGCPFASQVIHLCNLPVKQNIPITIYRESSQGSRWG